MFLRIISGISAVLFLVAIIMRLFTGLLQGVELKHLFICFGLSIFLPYLSQFEAFGLKVELRKKVEELSGQVDGLTAQLYALPDYVLASEFENEKDFSPAKKYYNLSLMKFKEFWPSIFGLASINHDLENYDDAIKGYNEVLKYDKGNVYALNNLAAVYLEAPWKLHNPSKALEYANMALEIVPEMDSAQFYKGAALNLLGKYSEALYILKKLYDEDTLPGSDPYLLYEIAIANSNLGKGISQADLEQMFSLHRKEDGGKTFLEKIRDEEQKKLFSPADLPVLEKFIEENKG